MRNFVNMSVARIKQRPERCVEEWCKYVINECVKRNHFLDTTKLQNLLVLMQGEHLVIHGTPIFLDDIWAQRDGVYIEPVLRAYSHVPGRFKDFEKQIDVPIFNTERNIMLKVLDKYGSQSVAEIKKDVSLEKLCALKTFGEVVSLNELKYIFLFSERNA